MKFNLSEWALNNKGIVLYFMLLLGIIGAISYSKLSQKLKIRHLPLKSWSYKPTGQGQQPKKLYFSYGPYRKRN